MGLSSPELHIERVRARVRRGGHDIAAEHIHRRYEHSRLNLIDLLPRLTALRIYDNSADGDPAALKWLNKNDEVGMPTAVKSVVKTVAELGQTSTARIGQLVHANFARMIKDDPWLVGIRGVLSY